jgi:hypothetical protein
LRKYSNFRPDVGNALEGDPSIVLISGKPQNKV